MAKKPKFGATDFNFGANVKTKKSGAKAGGKSRKPSGVRTWKGRTFGS